MNRLIHMTKSDLALLAALDFTITDIGAQAVIINSETDNGFNTLTFMAGDITLQVYLDVRHEAGGAYQFTSESKQVLRDCTDTKPIIEAKAKQEIAWNDWQ